MYYINHLAPANMKILNFTDRCALNWLWLHVHSLVIQKWIFFMLANSIVYFYDVMSKFNYYMLIVKNWPHKAYWIKQIKSSEMLKIYK